MKKDNVDNFMSEHRDEFNDKAPSGKVWTGIERALFGAKKIALWNSLTLWRAAAVLLLGVSAIQFYYSSLDVQVSTDSAMQQDFVDVESFYTAQISEKVSLIRGSDLFMDDQFTEDFEKLEAMYAVLSEELKKRPSEKVKDALVLNMLVRIDLLNRQLQVMEESKQKRSV